MATSSFVGFADSDHGIASAFSLFDPLMGGNRSIKGEAGGDSGCWAILGRGPREGQLVAWNNCYSRRTTCSGFPAQAKVRSVVVKRGSPDCRSTHQLVMERSRSRLQDLHGNDPTANQEHAAPSEVGSARGSSGCVCGEPEWLSSPERQNVRTSKPQLQKFGDRKPHWIHAG